MGLAARITDFHKCTMINPGTGNSHVGGPVTGPGVATVLIANQPAAVVNDACTCTGGPPDAIRSGSSSVLIGGKPAARKGDPTIHNGTIESGCSSVIIGG